MLHTRVYFSRMCYQIAPRVLHFSAFICIRDDLHNSRVTLLLLLLLYSTGLEENEKVTKMIRGQLY